MSRLEVPKTKEEMQQVVDRFGRAAAIIAFNQVHVARFEGFKTDYADKDLLDATINGREETYGSVHISGVTAHGDLVHARLHKPVPDDYDPSLQYLGVIDSIYDTGPAELWKGASVHKPVWRSSVTETIITMTDQLNPEPILRLVDEDEPVPPEDTALLEMLADASTPQIVYGINNAQFRVDFDVYEKLYNLQEVSRNVTAIRAELSTSALRQLNEPPVSELQPTGSDE